jgi:ubiquinone/menaquinone biosynthesis C-methylase UbiE
MSFFIAAIYDRFMATTEEACLAEWRSELLKNISGNVLEIGAGTGANLHLYPETLSSLVLSEPDPHMRRQLEKKIPSKNYDITVSPGTAENINADNDTFDYVVTSLVCCSVSTLDGSLYEIHRVLKPGGRFVFLEHVAAEKGTRRRQWQNLINPLWRKVAGNCHLNRETESAILATGFKIVEIKRESMRKAPPIVRPTIRGIAEKQTSR